MPIDYVVANGDPITTHADMPYVDFTTQLQNLAAVNLGTMAYSIDFTTHTTSTTDYTTWVNTEWSTGDWWYRRQNELWEADQIKFNNPFDDEYRTVTETDKDNEDFDTTEIRNYLETLREEVVVTED